MKGIIEQTLDWLTHPLYSDSDIWDWVGGLVLVLFLSFLWSTVIRQID
jgi:hypothetical protein